MWPSSTFNAYVDERYGKGTWNNIQVMWRDGEAGCFTDLYRIACTSVPTCIELPAPALH